MAGKGDNRRPSLLKEREWSERWEKTFGGGAQMRVGCTDYIAIPRNPEISEKLTVK